MPPLLTPAAFQDAGGSNSSGSGVTYPITLAQGGTSAVLMASNGGIVYCTATAMAILAGTATARQMLQSGASSAPAWSTSTWPATTTVNQLLYSSGANTVTGLATANSGVLVTDGSGVPSISSTLPTAVQTNITEVGTLSVGSIPASLITSGAALTRTNDTNVTVTLGGTPTTALLVATSLTLGWTGTLAPARGGLGFDASAVALGGIVSGTGSGTWGITAVGSDGQVLEADSGSAGGVKWATVGGTGTVTHTAGVLTAHAVVLGNAGADIKVLGSLGTTTTVLHGNAAGDPSFAAVSLTADVSGILPAANGGTGINNSNTITLGGNVSTAGAFSTSGAHALIATLTADTNVTFPTSGTLQTTTGTPAGFVIASQAAGDILYASSSTVWARLPKSTDGYVLTLASGLPSWVAGGSGTVANPTATIGLTAVNGSASSAIRSDGAPALSQAIVPTWTGLHTFQAFVAVGKSGTYGQVYGVDAGQRLILDSESAGVGAEINLWGSTNATPARIEMFCTSLRLATLANATRITYASDTIQFYQQNNFSRNGKSPDAVYGPATTDGFVEMLVIAPAATTTSASLAGYTDGSNPPTTLLAFAFATQIAPNTNGSATMKVKKGDYWTTVSARGGSGSFVTFVVNWVPNGTNA